MINEKKVKKGIVLLIDIVIIIFLIGFSLIILIGVIMKNNILDYICYVLLNFFIIGSFYIDHILAKKYYSSKASGWATGRYSFIALINPKPYFKKKNFNKAYFLYILREIFTIMGLVLLIIMFPVLLKSRYS